MPAKHRYSLWLCCLLGILSYPAYGATNKVVNLYTYPAYFPPQVLKQFEQETGVHVNVSIIYGDNRVLFSKLKAMPSGSYDLAMVANYSLDRFARADLLQTLDPKKIPNAKHLTPTLMNAINPSASWRALPFIWGTTGILVNRKLHPRDQIRQWRDLWQPAYRQKLLLIDDMRDVTGMASQALGHTPDTSNKEQLQALKLKLQALRPNIRVFSSSNMINMYVNEEIGIGMSWSGEAYLAQQANPNLVYIYPEEGASLWIDTLVMVKHAPHAEEAYQLLNFLCRPDIAKTIMEAQGTTVANASAMKLLPPDLQQNPTFNPPQSVLAKAKLHQALGDAQANYETLWRSFKLYTALGK